jgi:hypothetical protein
VVRIPVVVETFYVHHHHVQKTGPRPTRPPTQWAPEAFPIGCSGRGLRVEIHLHLMLRSKMRGVITLLLHTFLWLAVSEAQDKFTFYLQQV